MRAARLVVTRPAPEAARWVQALQARGQAAVALPLIDIATQPLEPHRLLALAAPDALMFVSAAAVRGFFAQPAARAWAGDARCWVTGPGTSAALAEAGVAAERIDAPPGSASQFDSEALWAVVQGQAQPGLRVCIVRGGDAEGRPAGRDWLAQTLAAAGAAVDTLVVYRRRPPTADAAWQATVQEARAARDVWLFSSSESVVHLGAACPGLDWSASPALATHPRIAEAARVAGFSPVRVVPPRLEDVLAALQAA